MIISKFPPKRHQILPPNRAGRLWVNNLDPGGFTKKPSVIWLVVFRHPSEKSIKVSWDDFSIPNMMGKS